VVLSSFSARVVAFAALDTFDVLHWSSAREMPNELLTVLAILQCALVSCLPSGPITAITSSSAHTSSHLHHSSLSAAAAASSPSLSSPLSSALPLSPSSLQLTLSPALPAPPLILPAASQVHQPLLSLVHNTYWAPPLATDTRLLHRIQLLRSLHNLHYFDAVQDQLQYSLASAAQPSSSASIRVRPYQAEFSTPLRQSPSPLFTAFALDPTTSLLPFNSIHSRYSASVPAPVSSNNKPQPVPSKPRKPSKSRKNAYVITSAASAPSASASLVRPVQLPSIATVSLPPTVLNFTKAVHSSYASLSASAPTLSTPSFPLSTSSTGNTIRNQSRPIALDSESENDLSIDFQAQSIKSKRIPIVLPLPANHHSTNDYSQPQLFENRPQTNSNNRFSYDVISTNRSSIHSARKNAKFFERTAPDSTYRHSPIVFRISTFF
jgi:hypothetical protein